MATAPTRVLLIDDDDDDYVLTRGLLSSIPGTRFALDWVNTWGAGLEAMARNEHALYLLDYRLGPRSGTQLLIAARARGCTGPAIVLTGVSDRDLDIECQAAGAADYLVKGQTGAVLLERSIRYTLDRHRTLEELERQRAELARSNAELERQRAELARSNAELEQFASIVSHDLRSPLQVISGYVEMLALRYRGRLDEKADDYIDRTLKGVGRLDALITDLLAFARLDGEERPHEVLDLGVAVDNAVADLHATLVATGAEVEHGELGTVRGNPVQIDQVLRNLIGNAVKFRGAAPPRIVVESRAKGDEVQVSVRDNGLGIPFPYQDKVFRMFQRGPGAENVPGTGIGLAICKKIVERHRGRIWLESEPGRGSIFSFTLPAASG